MAEPVEIDLRAVRFERQVVTLLQAHGMTARVFRYATGVAAVSIATPVGEVTILPFKGQQVWDASFGGRRLTMRSMFDEPQDTSDYLSTYGAFLIHCGITAMGGPGPGDSHPLHGELPNARFQAASLIAGSDADGPYLALAGECRQARAFGFNYCFRSQVTLRPDKTYLDVAISVENLRPVPLDVMYLAHINFRAVDDGRLVDTVVDDRTDIEVRRDHPAGLAISPEQHRLVEELAADPARHRHLAAGRRIDPEIVLFLTCRPDQDGWAHGLQIHPDGNGDFVRYKPAELPVAVRWISRTGDQEALGLILPATSGVDGYSAEKAKGRVVTLAGGATYACGYRCGALDPAQTQHLARRIDQIARGAGPVSETGVQ